MTQSSAFKLLLLCVLVLPGCRVQTLYLNGEGSAVVVDALTAEPIAEAQVNFCGVRRVTGDDGAFHVAEKTDWEVVNFLAGRSPLDNKRPCFVSIEAPGYQARHWEVLFDRRYEFPVRMLPAGSHLTYKVAEHSTVDVPLQVEPQVDEVFVPR